MGKKWESAYPTILSILISAIIYWLGLSPVTDGYEKVLDGVITFISIVIGFLAALLAIILSISKSKVMLHVYEYIGENNDGSKGKNILFSFFRQSIISGFISVMFSIGMYLIQGHKAGLTVFDKCSFGLWLFISVFFVLSAYRIINLLMSALFIDAKPDPVQTVQVSSLPNDELEQFKRDSVRHKQNLPPQ